MLLVPSRAYRSVVSQGVEFPGSDAETSLTLRSFQFVCGRVGSSSTCNLLEGVYCLSKTPSLLDLKWIKALRIKRTYYSIESVAKAGHSASAHAQTLSPWIPSQKHLVAG